MKLLKLQLLVMVILMNSSFIVQGMLLSKKAQQEQSSRMIMKKKAEAKAKQEKELAETRIRIEKEVAETRIRMAEARVKAEAKERKMVEEKSQQKEQEGPEAFLKTTTIGEIKKLDQELENYLLILGLNVHSTPLTIRSHYDSLMKRKLDDNEREKVENAYNSLINMLSITPFYAKSLESLKNMSNIEVEALSKEMIAKQEKEAAAARLRMAEARVKAEAKERERIEEKSKQKEQEGPKAFLTTTTIGEIKKSDQELKNYLFILGLNIQSTPFAIRSHYDLLMKKKLDDNERVKVENAYASLLNMLSITPFYATSLKNLKNMSNIEIKTLFDEKFQKNNFIKISTLPESAANIEKKLQVLEKEWDEYFSNPGFGLKKTFKLKRTATRSAVQQAYNKYIKENNLNNLKEQQENKKISDRKYSEKELKLKKIKEAYKAYAQEKGLTLPD